MSVILPEDAEHPTRLDLPIWRHLTFVEAHAIELGAGFGIFVVWALVVGDASTVVPLVAMVARKLVSRQRAAGEGTSCEHDIGFHDAVAESPYFVVATVTFAAATYAVTLAF